MHRPGSILSVAIEVSVGMKRAIVQGLFSAPLWISGPVPPAGGSRSSRYRAPGPACAGRNFRMTGTSGEDANDNHMSVDIPYRSRLTGREGCEEQKKIRRYDEDPHSCHER